MQTAPRPTLSGRRSGPIARLSAALLLTAWTTGCGAREEPPLNVVLICLDTVRAGHLGVYGYERRPTSPSLDRLAESAWVFGNASSSANWTKPSVATYLTGLLPAQHGVYLPTKKRGEALVGDVLPEAATTLAETFSADGYATAAIVNNSQIDRGLGYEQGFDSYVDHAGNAGEIRERALRWLGERDQDRPFFLYLHLLDAHPPFLTPPREALERFSSPGDAQQYSRTEWNATRLAVNAGRTQIDEASVDALVTAYDGAIRYMDDELGALFDELERSGRMDDTVICVISDHGEEFLEKTRLGHGRGHDLYETLLHVVWILRVPGEEHRWIETPCSLVDLYPTLLSASRTLGIEAARDAEARIGIDRLERPLELHPIVAENLDDRGYQQSIRLGENKVIRRLSPEGPARRKNAITRESLVEALVTDPESAQPVHEEQVWSFDLERDPSENSHDVVLDPQEDLADLGQRLLRDLFARRLWNAGDEAELSADRLEDLREIGYAGEDEE